MKLDDWMKENRASFDQEEAPEGLWTEIQKAVPAPQKRSSTWLWWSAAAILILGATWWFKPQQASLPPVVEESSLPANFLAQEEEYQQDLKLMESHINLQSLAEDPEYAWVFEELAELESINKQYRSDLGALAPQEELLTVLIDYYEKRLRLLQRLQMEIERKQNHLENENINL
jgi:hypothetical protein